MEIVRAPDDVNKAIDSMVHYLTSLVVESDDWVLIGIADGGIPLTTELKRRFEQKTGQQLPIGILNVSFHRDDIGSRPIVRPKHPTNLPVEIQNTSVILVDDVVHSGRTTRAALDELFEHGRPRVVKLISLVDRGNRVVPIQPDFAAMTLELESEQKLKVVIDSEDSQGNRIWTGRRGS